MSQTFWENEVSEEMHTEQPFTEPQAEAQMAEHQRLSRSPSLSRLRIRARWP